MRHFDAIVVGSGLGGLTAGALYARAGRRVLVLERHNRCGGAATVYRHGPLTIDASLHEIDGLDEGDPKMAVIRSLGLDRDLKFVDVGDIQEVRGARIGDPFVLPHGFERAFAVAAARFPQHAEGLREYFDRVAGVREAVRFAGAHRDDRSWWLLHAPEAVRRLWPLIREGRATVGEVLDELFGADERIKMILAANLAYYHDDPDRMLFVSYAIPQASYLAGGGHYVHGGSQALSDRLVELIRAAGGAVECDRTVEHLLLDGDRVLGVDHRGKRGDDPRTDFAPVVFGNAAPQRLADMLPDAKRAAFKAPYEQRRLSISLWTVSVGLKRPAREFGVRHYSTFVLPSWMTMLGDFRQAGGIMGDPGGGCLPPYVFVDYHQIDSGLNATGPYLGTFCGIDRLANWVGLTDEQKRTRKQVWMALLIGDLDRQFPGIADAVVQREMATAATMARYLNTPDGAVYGFAPEGGLGTLLSASPRTSIEGLYLASAFTMGGGFTGAMLGGEQAARAALAAAPETANA